MSHEQILTDVRGRVGIITLNRPDRLNAITSTMRTELRNQMRDWNDNDGIGAMVITGAGRGFCSGSDIGGFEARVQGTGTAEEPRFGETEWVDLVRESKPIVCAINGVAVGEGITLTLMCDARVAAEGARMSFRFVRIGLTPEFASTHHLIYLVGLGRTLELMLTGKFVLADEAYRIGLVNHVFPPDQMLDKAVALAQEMADNPAWHLREVKRLVHSNYLERDLATVISEEQKIFRQSQASDAHKEALVAFRERREPRFH